jgi:hypothetical protein
MPTRFLAPIVCVKIPAGRKPTGFTGTLGRISLMMLAVSMARLMFEWISTDVHNQQEVLFLFFDNLIPIPFRNEYKNLAFLVNIPS